MVDHSKLIEFINSTGVTKVFTSAVSRIKWEGVMPEGAELVAHESNVFGSAKNTQAFIDMVNSLPGPKTVLGPVTTPAPTLQEVIEKYDVITDEVAKVKGRGPRPKKEDK